jgi:C-terminal processing protease CtpA/Prc
MPGTAVDAVRRCFTLVALGASAWVGIACGPAPHGTIGAILGQQNDGRVFIRDAPADLAAAQAGLQPGDEILFIDGVQASSLSPERLSEVLGGPVGAPVQLTVLRKGEVLRITVTRSEARQYSGNLKSGQ